MTEPSHLFRVYCDEDSHSHILADVLRREGVDVLRSTDAGMDGRSDEEQFAFAAAEDRVIFSGNIADFLRLHYEYVGAGRHHSGLVLWVRGRYSGAEHGRRLLRLLEAYTHEGMADRVEFLGDWGGEERR